jgi:ferritin-like metal-binding protein YciE
MAISTFRELLVFELEDIYIAELQLIANLPKLEKAAVNIKLKEAINSHFHETKNQAKRLENIFKSLNIKAKAKKCLAMEGLIKELAEFINLENKSSLKDAALIAAAQRIEHYEISAYGSAKSHAKLLGLKSICDLLEESEDEESAADQKLNKIAEGSFFSEGINIKAMQEQRKEERKIPQKPMKIMANKKSPTKPTKPKRTQSAKNSLAHKKTPLKSSKRGM